MCLLLGYLLIFINRLFHVRPASVLSISADPFTRGAEEAVGRMLHDRIEQKSPDAFSVTFN